MSSLGSTANVDRLPGWMKSTIWRTTATRLPTESTIGKPDPDQTTLNSITG